MLQLIDMCSRLSPPRDEEKQKPSKNAPSTSDKAVTVDDRRDDTVEWYTLDSLAKIFDTVLAKDKTQTALSTISDKVLHFCHAHVDYSFSVAIRVAAAKCLGILSQQLLPRIVAPFTKQAGSVKKDAELRAYAAYQKAIPELR